MSPGTSIISNREAESQSQAFKVEEEERDEAEKALSQQDHFERAKRSKGWPQTMWSARDISDAAQDPSRSESKPTAKQMQDENSKKRQKMRKILENLEHLRPEFTPMVVKEWAKSELSRGWPTR